MSKLKAVIVSCVMVLMATALMGGLYIFSSISYSLPDSDIAYQNDITINNIEVLLGVDTYRVDGPNLVGNDIKLDIDLLPNESYTFRYDINNFSEFDYNLKEFIISCDNNDNVLNYIDVDVRFEDGTQVKENTIIPAKTRRTVYVTVKYDKNFNDIQSFRLYFDNLFEMV